MVLPMAPPNHRTPSTASVRFHACSFILFESPIDAMPVDKPAQ
jgi:hypothetical protein